MRQRSTLCLLLAIAGFSLAICLCAFAQQDEPKGKREEFGSSLKKLKWDAKKEAAVEANGKQPKGKKPKPGGKVPVESDDVVRVETVLAVFDMLVVDKKGRAVAGLKPEDFIVKEDGRPQEIGTFALGNDANRPRSIVLIIDYSGSQRPYIENSVAAAKILVDKLGPRDRMAIVTDDVALLVDFTQDKSALKAKLDTLEQNALWNRKLGRSAQYSALLATLRELMVGEERPIVLFQTDGDELMWLQPMAENRRPMMNRRAQEFGLTDIIAAAQKTRTTIYTIIPGLRFVGLSPEEQIAQAKRAAENSAGATFNLPAGQGRFRAGMQQAPDGVWVRAADRWQRQQAALATVSKLTGGWPEFLERPEQASAIYSRILADINRRYIIGYYPTNTARDGKLRKVSFEVRNHPEYVVWGRKSYYAPEN